MRKMDKHTFAPELDRNLFGLSHTKCDFVVIFVCFSNS